MKHAVIYESLLSQWVHPMIAKAILPEYFDLRAAVRMADADVSSHFPYCSDGRQGSIETPDIFNIVVFVCFGTALRSD